MKNSLPGVDPPMFKSAISAHIMSYAYASDYKVYYWRTKPGCEVDYVLEK